MLDLYFNTPDQVKESPCGCYLVRITEHHKELVGIGGYEAWGQQGHDMREVVVVTAYAVEDLEGNPVKGVKFNCIVECE